MAILKVNRAHYVADGWRWSILSEVGSVSFSAAGVHMYLLGFDDGDTVTRSMIENSGESEADVQDLLKELRVAGVLAFKKMGQENEVWFLTDDPWRAPLDVDDDVITTDVPPPVDPDQLNIPSGKTDFYRKLGNIPFHERRNQRQNFTIIPNEVLENDELSMQARSVYVFLASYCYDESVCWPTLGQLSEKMKISETTLRRYLNELVDAGLLEINREQGRGNSYRLYAHPTVTLYTNLNDDDF